jgi:hypothetical protein
MKKFIILFLFLNIAVYCQGLYIKGQAVSASDGSPLSKATAILIHLPDSVKIGIITENSGKFTFRNTKSGNYALVITYLGFEKFIKEINFSKSIDLGKLELSPSGIEQNAVVVIGKAVTVEQKGDTAVFNANSFKVEKLATTEDMLTKMPGITVQDGKVQAHGEDVKRVLVDGKPFFGDDPSAVLKNVPAEIVEKIQVYDEQSDQSKFTGFDDGNTSKTINLITRSRVKEGTFGKLSGSYGNDDMYKASGSLNIFQDDQRITLLGMGNNVNEQNFSSDDLLGVMSSQGGSRGGRMGSGHGGGESSNFTVSSKGGLTKTIASGVNYANKIDGKLDISGSYFFNRAENNTESSLNREYFLLQNSGQNYSENSSSDSKNINHRVNMKIEYQIDSLNSFIFRPKLSVQQNNGSSGYSGQTSSLTKILNEVLSNSSSNYNALNTSADLLLQHKFETKGRTMSLALNSSYKNNSGNNNYFSESKYYNTKFTADTSDQYSDMDKNGFGSSATLMYTEPLSNNGLIQFNAGMSYSEDKNDQKTYTQSGTGSYSLLDTALSNVYKKIYRTQTAGAGYRYQEHGLSFMAGINYNIAQLRNDGLFPNDVNTERNFYSFLPNLMLRYSISRDKNLRLSYRASNTAPTVDQLQNVLDNSNPVQLSTGNPNLKQTYSHAFDLRYSQTNMSTMNSIFIGLRTSYTNKYIGNDKIIASKDTTLSNGLLLRKGSQLTMPVNIDGYFSARSFITYGLPVDFLLSNVNLMSSVSFTRSPGIINNITNYSNSATYSGGIVIASNVSDRLDFNISTNSSYSKITNSSNKANDNSYFNQNTRFKFFWMFWKGLLIQTDLTHQYNSGLSSSYNTNTLLCNASLGLRFLRNDQAEIRLSVADLFDQNKNIQRNVTDTYYEDTRSNTLGRYYMLTMTYNIKAF